MDKRFEKNIKILNDNGIVVSDSPMWEDKPNFREFETFTPGGEDMILCLDEPSKKALIDYCDSFDINGEVMLWWRDGAATAHAKGVPFDNIKEHYEDYEAYLEELLRVAELLD